jgi:DegV family protein with EDD domain
MADVSVAIVSDSTLDLPDEMLAELGIELAPVHVLAEGKDYRDRIDIRIEEANRLMVEGRVRLTTAGASAQDFANAYEAALRRAPHVVAFSISPTLSVTYQNALAARQLFEDADITVLETKTVLAAMGLVVKAAAEAARRGASKAEVIALAERLIPRVRMVVTSQSTAFAKLGGRYSAETPAAEAEEGYPVFRIWERGWREIERAPSRRAALERVLGWMAKDLAELGHPGPGRLVAAVDHIVCPEEAAWLRAETAERFRPDELHVWQIGPTAGAHLGPGTVGVAYLYDPEA